MKSVSKAEEVCDLEGIADVFLKQEQRPIEWLLRATAKGAGPGEGGGVSESRLLLQASPPAALGRSAVEDHQHLRICLIPFCVALVLCLHVDKPCVEG